MSRWRRAVVTGASSGLGQAFARKLATGGTKVTLVARRAERLEELAEELRRLGGQGEPLPADLSVDDEVSRVIGTIEAGPAPELLVHAAGFGTRRFLVDLEPEKIEAMIRLHCLATTRLTRAVLPEMIERRQGAIVNISSMAALFTTSRYTTYSATKSFLNAFSAGLAVELEGTGVQVQALCPGLTTTEFFYAPDYEGFDYPLVPKWAWQRPETVIEESLAALDRDDGKVEVIPGRLNRVFYKVMRTHLASTLMARAARGSVNAADRPW